MSKEISWWTRLNWNPIFVGILLLFWLRPLIRSGWDFSEVSLFGWFGISVTGLWFLLGCWNVVSGGSLLEFLYSDDDDELPEIPDRLEIFLNANEMDAPLVNLLRENLPAGKDLEEALDDYEGEELTESDEALAVVTAYRELCLADDPRSVEVLNLFGQSGSVEVWGCYYHMAMPLVHERFLKITERGGTDDDVSDFEREEFPLLRALCGYGYPPAYPDVVRAGRNPKLCESFMWGRIYDAGQPGDDEYLTLIKEIGKELPEGFAGVAFLDCCNQLSIEHEVEPHAFSSDAGVARLREYLTDADPEHFSYAGSAATALAFIGHPGRDELLELAKRHRMPAVGVEAAWAGAKLGREAEIAKLVELTKDWKTGDLAMTYLRELDLEGRIPAASLEPAHVALCEMAGWLAHPNELTELPDEVKIVDQREIFWPPLERRATLAIVRWWLREESGVGTTGGTTTWCFFGNEEVDEPPLDIYARHCNWQLSAVEIEGAPASCDDLEFGRKLLREKNPGEDWAGNA